MVPPGMQESMGKNRPDQRQRHARVLRRQNDPERLEGQPEIELGLPVRLRTMVAAR